MHSDAPSQLWIWRGDSCCRLLIDASVEPEHRASIARACGARPTPGVPEAVAWVRSSSPPRWDLEVQGTVGRHTDSGDDLLALPRSLWRALGWPWVSGELLTRDGRGLWLVGPAAAALRVHLCDRGWDSLGPGATPDALTGRVALGAGATLGGHLVRCQQRPSAPISLEATPPAEAQTWLRGPGVDPALREVVLAAFAPMRLLLGDLAEAQSALEKLPRQPEQATPPVRYRERTVALGDGRLQLITSGLDDDEERLIDYVTQPLATDPSPTAALFGVGRSRGVHWMASLEPTHWRGADTETVATTLLHLDNVLQRGLLDLDRGHAIFLGSAVQRGDTVIWLSGLRNSGKTSLAIELVEQHAFWVVADDFVPWHPEAGRLSTFQKPFRLRAGAFGTFPGLAESGIRVPPTEDTAAAWFLSPTAGGHRGELEPGGQGLFVRCFLDPTMTEPVRIEARPRARVVADLQKSPRPPAERAALATSIEAIADRFDGVSLWYRDREAAAQAIAERAAG